MWVLTPVGHRPDGGFRDRKFSDVREEHPHGLKFLLDNGWIKHQMFLPQGFQCAISTDGIKEIDDNYFENYFSQIISTLGLSGNDWTGIMQMLLFEPKNYQIAFDIAKELEATCLAEVQYHHDEIYVKLNFQGRQFYEDKKATFK
jgi:hypothetical protein